MALPNIPQTPYQGANWPGAGPFSTSPAAAHAMLHPERQTTPWAVVDYMGLMQGRNNPYYLMQKYWPAGADQAAALRGLGASEDEGLLAVVGAAIIGALVVGATIRAVGGYQAGKAVAPDATDYKSYAIAGAVSGLIAGPAGMAAVAGVALYNERGRLWTKWTSSPTRASSRVPRGSTGWESTRRRHRTRCPLRP